MLKVWSSDSKQILIESGNFVQNKDFSSPAMLIIFHWLSKQNLIIYITKELEKELVIVYWDVTSWNGKMKQGERFIKTKRKVVFLSGKLGQRRELFIISGFSVRCL